MRAAYRSIAITVVMTVLLVVTLRYQARSMTRAITAQTVGPRATSTSMSSASASSGLDGRDLRGPAVPDTPQSRSGAAVRDTAVDDGGH